MAFFCEKSGVRIVTPGVAISAGGDAKEFEPEQSSVEGVDFALSDGAGLEVKLSPADVNKSKSAKGGK